MACTEALTEVGGVGVESEDFHTYSGWIFVGLGWISVLS
jgi:hypothetical protein